MSCYVQPIPVSSCELSISIPFPSILQLEAQRQQEAAAAAPPAAPALSERELRAAAAERRLQHLSLQGSGALAGVHSAREGGGSPVEGTGGPGSAVSTSTGVTDNEAPLSAGLSGGAARRQGSASAASAAAQGRACDVCGASLTGRTPFHRLAFAYCSTTCVRVHQAVMEESG